MSSIRRLNPPQPAMMRAVAVIGSTTIDRNVIAGRTYYKLGGVTAYAGITYRRHGLATWVVSNIAPADAVILERLKNAELRLLNGKTPLTTRFVNRVQGGRRHQEVPSMASPLLSSQVAAVVDKVQCLHLGPLHSQDIVAEAYEYLQGTSRLVVLDLQGLVRKIENTEVKLAVSERLPAALKAAAIVKTNQAELAVILGSWGGAIEDIMDHFQIAEWIVTDGAQGGRIYTGARRLQRYSSVAVADTADPTGAGDVFLAAYAVARGRDRKKISEASRHAARLSSDQVAGRYIPYQLLSLSIPDQD